MYNKVYIIDDDEISVFLTQTMLEVMAFAREYEGFMLAEQALDKLLMLLRNGELDKLPNVVFLDLNMPLMSGWDLVDTLKPFESVLSDCCRIYILTSSVDEVEQAKARQYPLIAGFLQKPLDEQAILQIS